MPPGALGLPVAALSPSEVTAARLAYGLHMARPRLSTAEISARLARDHGLHEHVRANFGRGANRHRPFKCKRLRRMMAAYESFVAAGVEPEPETIFGGDNSGTEAGHVR